MDNQAIVLVSETSPQIKLFIEYLSHSLGFKVMIQSPSVRTPSTCSKQSILLLDADCMDLATMQSWYLESELTNVTNLAAFNVKNEEQGYALVSGLQLRGIFYQSSSLELFCKGIETLCSGQLWMSRSLMSRLVEVSYQQQRCTYRPICGLSNRELQILEFLSAGASNHEIAQGLFISLHTVKSHLYNIFRKIDVNNRVEAVNWTRQHLGTPPPLEKITKPSGPRAEPLYK